MKKPETVIKTKAEIRPIPETIARIFGTVETPPALSDEQPKTQKTISYRSRKELLDLTKELRKINPDGEEVKSEEYKDFRLYLYNIRLQNKDK